MIVMMSDKASKTPSLKDIANDNNVSFMHEDNSLKIQVYKKIFEIFSPEKYLICISSRG